MLGELINLRYFRFFVWPAVDYPDLLRKRPAALLPGDRQGLCGVQIPELGNHWRYE